MKWNDLKQGAFWWMCSLLGAIVVLIVVQYNITKDLEQKQCEVVRLEERIEDLKITKDVKLAEMVNRHLENRAEMLQPRLDPVLREKIVTTVMENSETYGLSPSLVLHLICRETVPRFSPLSKSSKDAIGLMQVRYEVHKKDIPELAKLKPVELYHIDNNIKFGCMILRKYIDSTETLSQALKRYVGGDLKGYVNDICRMMAEYEVEKVKE